MATETVTIQPVTREAGKHIVKFVMDFKAAVKAGNPVTQAITIAGAALNDLAPVLAQIPKIESEATTAPIDEITTAWLTVMDLYAAFRS